VRVERPWRLEGSAQVHCAAPPLVVYERIADVTATGERSAECYRCRWLPGAEPASVGSRFRGSNRFGPIRWSRVCEVVEADPGRRFAFRTVPERIDPTRADSTLWSYDLQPDGDGSLVTHAYRITKPPLQPLRWLYGIILPHHRDMRPHLQYTLEVLRDGFRTPTTT
jgi:hypothetical protein